MMPTVEAKRKAKAPARAAIEALMPLVNELREIEKNLVGIEAQAASIPPEADEKADKLLGGEYRKHAVRLKALGLTTADPCADDLRTALDAFATLARAFGTVLDTTALPRAKAQIWTSSEEFFDFVDDRHIMLRPGLKLAPDGSVKKAPQTKPRLHFSPPLVW